MSKGIVNRRDKFLWDNSAKPSITDVEGGGGGGTLLKSVSTPVIPYVEIYDDNGTWKAKDFYNPDFTGHYYQFENTGGTEFPQEIITVQMYDMGDPMGSFTLDLREMPSNTWNLYALGTGETTMEYYGTEEPVVTTEYEELTLGSGLSVSGSTLNGPNLSQYGKALEISSGNIQLKNGSTILSEVTPPGIVSAEEDEDNYNLKFKYGNGSTQNVHIPTLSVKRFTISEDDGTYTFDDGVKARDVMNAVDTLNGSVELVVSVSSNATQNKIFRLGYYQNEDDFTFQSPLYSFVCIHNLDNSANALTVENIVLTNKNATTVTINTKNI